MSRNLKRSVLGAALMAVVVSACSAGATIKIDGPYARMTGPDRPAAAYFVIANETDTADALIGAASPAFGKVELHETYAVESSEMPSADPMASIDPMASMDPMPSMDGGMMGMRPVAEIPVPANGSVALEPGGFHVMLMEPVSPLEIGQVIDLTLTFKNAGEVKVKATIQGV